MHVFKEEKKKTEDQKERKPDKKGNCQLAGTTLRLMLTVGMLGHLSRIPRAKGSGSTVKGWGEEGRDVAPRAVYSTDTWRDEEQRA